MGASRPVCGVLLLALSFARESEATRRIHRTLASGVLWSHPRVYGAESLASNARPRLGFGSLLRRLRGGEGGGEGASEGHELLTCRNYGCQSKRYYEKDNHDEACLHHKAGPVFRDGYKYWGCCEDMKSQDFDSFMRVKGCTRGRHSTAKPQEVWKMSPSAQACIDAEKAQEERAKKQAEDEKRVSEIHQKELNRMTGGSPLLPQGQETIVGAAPPEPPPQLSQFKPPPMNLPEGHSKCVHTACGKVYVTAENTNAACSYHTGGPVFHDGTKWWSCCSEDNKQIDFDGFMKIPKCAHGFHWDGTGTDPNAKN